MKWTETDLAISTRDERVHCRVEADHWIEAHARGATELHREVLARHLLRARADARAEVAAQFLIEMNALSMRKFREVAHGAASSGRTVAKYMDDERLWLLDGSRARLLPILNIIETPHDDAPNPSPRAACLCTPPIGGYWRCMTCGGWSEKALC